MANVVVILLTVIVSVTTATPIMVTFGTNQGPIKPPTPEDIIPAKPRIIIPRNPAPVSERTEDVPNPSTYRPLIPHQYRTKLYSFKPSNTLILGTPIDQKYTPTINKFDLYQKQSRAGTAYTGPHVFEVQPYEVVEAQKRLKTTLQPSTQYIKPHVYQQHQQQNQNQGRYVPQIGIVYSSGVRYYVPQLTYYEDDQQENSVYDRNDQKHFYRKTE